MSDTEYQIIEEATPTWSTSHTATITIEDQDSGLAQGAKLQYGWSTSTEIEPSTWTTVELTNYSEGDLSTSIEVTENEITGKYHLWVKPVSLENTAGEAQTETEISENQYWFDNTAPTVNALKNLGKVTVTMADIGSRVTSEQGEYYLSTSSTELIGGEWAEYTSGVETDITINITGNYYLFVKAVSDNVGNTSTQYGTITTIGEETYHMFGPYYFDNVIPTVTIETQENTTWSKSQSVTVKITDAGGLAANAELQYAWSEDGTNEPSEWETLTVKGYTEGDKSVSTQITNSTLTLSLIHI